MPDPNTFVNGSFEGGWYHPGNVPELQIPNGWMWHNFSYPETTNPIDPAPHSRLRRPEVNVKQRNQLPPDEQDLFILDGDQCLKAFLGPGAWWGGLTQSVQFDAAGQFDVVLNIFGDLVKGYRPDNSKIWADDPQGRDGLVRLKSGGGWSEWQSITPGKYEAYIWTVDIQGDGHAEISVEILCPFALPNAGIFADAWTIRPAEQEQYHFDSVIHLMPQDTTITERREVEAEVHQNKATQAYSADNAFANSPAMRTRRVDIWDADRWPGGKQGLITYAQMRHPPLPDELNWREFANGGNGGEWDQFLLWQRDPRWREHNYGAPGCFETVGESGCYLTCLAMAQRIEGIRSTSTPVTVDQDLGPSGYAAPSEPCRPWWSAIEDRLHLKVRDGTTAQVNQHLLNGGVAMAGVLPDTLEHFVLVVDRDSAGGYIALDPLRNEVITIGDVYAGVQSWRRLTPSDPDTEPQYPPVDKLITMHMQNPIPGWDTFVRDVQPEGFKIIHENKEVAQDIARLSPSTLVWFRHWHNNEGEFWNDPDVNAAVNRWLNRFWHPDLPSPGPNIKAVCGLNEQIATGAPEQTVKVVRFEAALAYEVHRRSAGRVKSVLLNPGVGNPGLDEQHLLLPAVQAAVDTDSFIGHHSYWGVTNNTSHLVSKWEWYAGRFIEHWDPVFRSANLYPRYLLTEVGAVWDDNGHLRAHNGWRDQHCYGGDWAHYLADIMMFRARVQAWNLEHGNRCLAASMFTSGGAGWDSFQLLDPQLRDLAAALNG